MECYNAIPLLPGNIIEKKNGVISLTPNGNTIYSEIIMAHRTLEIMLTKSGDKC